MFRWSVDVSIKLGIVGFILLEDVVDSGQQHSCNGNDSFFVTSAFLDIEIAITNLRIALGSDCTQSALNEQRFDICTCTTDSGSFFLTGTFIVLRRKPCPRA